MAMRRMGRSVSRMTAAAALVASLASCGADLWPFDNNDGPPTAAEMRQAETADEMRRNLGKVNPPPERSTVWDLFTNVDDPNTTVEVNKYLWQASLEVLNFLPIESVDPFSGVIVTGYGVPPGGGRAYRATIYVQDPALDARSLKLSLMTKGGAVDAATVRAVEDAILTRARQLRVRDLDL